MNNSNFVYSSFFKIRLSLSNQNCNFMGWIALNLRFHIMTYYYYHNIRFSNKPFYEFFEQNRIFTAIKIIQGRILLPFL